MRYLHPSDEELRQYAPNPITKDKKERRRVNSFLRILSFLIFLCVMCNIEEKISHMFLMNMEYLPKELFSCKIIF